MYLFKQYIVINGNWFNDIGRYIGEDYLCKKKYLQKSFLPSKY